MEAQRDYITVKEAAFRAHVSKELIRRWMRDHKFPYSKLGNAHNSIVRIRVNDFEKFLSSFYNGEEG